MMRKEQWRKQNRPALLGAGILGVWILLAVFVPLFWPYSYSDQDVALQNLAPSIQHWFGTDKFGRDLFARVWYGARLSLVIGVGSAGINGLIGVIWGAAAGYKGGRVDGILMGIADILASIPSMLYVILLTLVFGANAGSMILGLCISGWITMARIVRGEIQRWKEAEFAQAARLTGISESRLLFRHLLPNAAGPVGVQLLFLIPQAIFTEAFLSFLGVGIGAPAASLGTIIQEARSQMILYPYQMVCPLTVLCVMLLALCGLGTWMEKRTEPGRRKRA